MNLPESSLTRLNKLAGDATAGPWLSIDGLLRPDDEGHTRSFIRPAISDGYQIAQSVGPHGQANAAYIAAFHPEVGAELVAIARGAELLREALTMAVYEATHLSPQDADGSHWAKMSAAWLAKARAALAGDTSHD